MARCSSRKKGPVGRKAFNEMNRTSASTWGLDAHSRLAEPGFVDPSAGDYRLRPGSPARSLRADGGPVNAEMFWK